MMITDALPDSDIALPLQQHPDFARALQHMGVAATPTTIRVGAKRIGHALLVNRRIAGVARVGLVSQGPIWLASAQVAHRADAYAAYARQGVRLVNACAGDDVALGGARYHRIVTAATVAELDLAGDDSARRAGMSVKWRNRLSRAERWGVRWRSTHYDPGDNDWLLAEEASQRKAKHYRNLSLSFTRAWAAANPGKSRLFVAYDGRQRIAAMLFLIHGRVASYHIGWSGQLGREAMAHNLLFDRAAGWLAERGVTRLDLGTIDTESAPGLARFKLGTGARAVALGGTWLNLRG